MFKYAGLRPDEFEEEGAWETWFARNNINTIYLNTFKI